MCAYWSVTNRYVRMPDERECEILGHPLFAQGGELDKIRALADKRCMYPPVFSIGSLILMLHPGGFPTDGIFFREYRLFLEMINDVPGEYSTIRLPKQGGGFRVIHRVSPRLRIYQDAVRRTITDRLPVSEYAYAYVKGRSIEDNAAAHCNRPQMTKLDIRGFFDSISSRLVYAVLRDNTGYNSQVLTALTKLVTLNGALPQGASTSPSLSNAVMYGFDKNVGDFCSSRNIVYTRYSDDLTFSGEGYDQDELIGFVRSELSKLGLRLNGRKTRTVSGSSRHIVTGLVSNSYPHVPKEYINRIRQDVHYCSLYGPSDHISHMKDTSYTPYLDHIGTKNEIEYMLSLIGRIKYAAHYFPDNIDLMRYRVKAEDILSLYTGQLDDMMKDLMNKHFKPLIKGFRGDCLSISSKRLDTENFRKGYRVTKYPVMSVSLSHEIGFDEIEEFEERVEELRNILDSRYEAVLRNIKTVRYVEKCTLSYYKEYELRDAVRYKDDIIKEITMLAEITDILFADR